MSFGKKWLVCKQMEENRIQELDAMNGKANCFLEHKLQEIILEESDPLLLLNIQVLPFYSSLMAPE